MIKKKFRGKEADVLYGAVLLFAHSECQDIIDDDDKIIFWKKEREILNKLHPEIPKQNKYLWSDEQIEFMRKSLAYRLAKHLDGSNSSDLGDNLIKITKKLEKELQEIETH